MATRRLFDGASIEIGQVPIKGAEVPPGAGAIAWIKVAGVWKQTTVWIKESGVWKTATPYVKVLGQWE
jgi:hypothetical protein